MNAAASVQSLHGHPLGWPVNPSKSDRRSTGIAVALLVHGMAAWLVLSGTGARIVRDARPTMVVIPQPQEPDPPPIRPPDPPSTRSATVRETPRNVEVPVPEKTPAASTDAPVLAPQSGMTTDVPATSGTATVPQTAPVPRGFGSITNRAECSAAFNQSFPREARRNAQQGAVTLQVRVSAAGVVEAAEVIAAQPRRVFDRAALGVILSGACKFESDFAGYVAVLEVNYRLAGESAD